MAPKITPVRHFVQSHLQFHLNPNLSVEDIQKILGPKIQDQGRSWDDKVTHSWDFSIDGVDCSIWDYKGLRWSAFGSETLFKAVGFQTAGDHYR